LVLTVLMARLALLLPLVVALASAGTWSVLKKDIETIAIGISFVNQTHGWIPGDQNGVGALFIRTQDGGNNWIPCPHNGYVTIPMGIAMEVYNGVVSGVISGLGIGRELPPMEYTADGFTFQAPSPNPDFIGESQDAKVIHGLVGAFGLPGTFTNSKDQTANGLQGSFDGGKTWQNYDVGFEDPLARYGHFPDPSNWYIAAGDFPSLSKNTDPDVKVINSKLSIHKEKGVQWSHLTRPARSLQQEYGYKAAIAASHDGGKTWATVYNDTGNFYFNDIDCPTATDCWVVGESESDSSEPGVRILHSGDSGATWQVQYYNNNPDYSLMEVAMLNSQEGWACGGLLTHSITGEFWHTTNGGVTWNLEQSVADAYCTAISFVQPTGSPYLGWATAFTLEGQSSVLVYK